MSSRSSIQPSVRSAECAQVELPAGGTETAVSEDALGLGCEDDRPDSVLLARSFCSCDVAGERDKLQSTPYLIQLEQGACSLH
jgi:hypothetical protein